jgi:hypothetical protein
MRRVITFLIISAALGHGSFKMPDIKYQQSAKSGKQKDGEERAMRNYFGANICENLFINSLSEHFHSVVIVLGFFLADSVFNIEAISETR